MRKKKQFQKQYHGSLSLRLLQLHFSNLKAICAGLAENLHASVRSVSALRELCVYPGLIYGTENSAEPYFFTAPKPLGVRRVARHLSRCLRIQSISARSKPMS